MMVVTAAHPHAWFLRDHTDPDGCTTALPMLKDQRPGAQHYQH